MRLEFFGLITFGLLDGVLGRVCDQVRSRPNINKMPEADRNRYFDAVKWLNSGQKPTRWDEFARKHVAAYEQVHTKPCFAAWHRMYVYELETMLREYHKDVRIPYFDWTVNYNDLKKDPVWQWYGKTGDPNRNNCVYNGTFNNFKVYYGGSLNEPGSERCFKRNQEFPQTFSDSKQSIEHDVIDEQDPGNFMYNLERGGHANFHNGVGYDFSGHISTNDPLFFAHHAFIDMIWFVRQMRHANWGYNYPESKDFQLPGYSEKIKDVLDPTDLCYTYHEDNYSFRSSSDISRSSRVSAASIQKPEPFVPLESSQNGTLSEVNITKHAYDYIFKGVKGPIPGQNQQFNNTLCPLIVFNTPLTLDFINRMKYGEVETRQFERKKALFISGLNSQCLRN